MIKKLSSQIVRTVHEAERFYKTYRLTFYTGLAVLLLCGLTVSTLAAYYVDSVARAQTARNELTDRDLRDLISRFDTDERFVLQHNIAKLVGPSRALTPLLLPRPYYLPLPANRNQTSPRQPPRNCFVTMQGISQVSSAQPMGDRVCAYFLDKEDGRGSLYLAMDIIDRSIVTLKYGDPRLLGDSIRLDLESERQHTIFWITFLASSTGPDRYEISAFRELPSGVKERDRRLEGWAYTQKQSDGTQVLRILARIDSKAFPTLLKDDSARIAWENFSLSMQRRDYSAGTKAHQVTDYGNVGTSNLALATLSESMFGTFASLHVSAKSNAANTISGRWLVGTSSDLSESKESGWFSYEKDAFVVKRNPFVRTAYLPDTNLQFVVTYPRWIIGQGTWQVLFLLFLLALGGIIAIILAYRMLLKPIYALTREARLLTLYGTARDRLRLDNHKYEIGILAGAFNELIGKLREHIEREDHERRVRQTQEAARFEASKRNWIENLEILGHEIRSPLQGLMSIHGPESDSRKLLERISAALPHLQLGLSPEQAAHSRVLESEPICMFEYLQEIANNARLNINDVEFVGGPEDLFCEIDPDTFANVLDNILQNADRHRNPGSTIAIRLFDDEDNCLIQVENYGPPIDPTVMDSMFKFGVSTASPEKGYGRGIGLWQAQLYVDRMQGTISAKNVDGGIGVCMSIWLPVTRPTERA